LAVLFVVLVEEVQLPLPLVVEVEERVALVLYLIMPANTG
jgi:hypothetical protein